MVDENGLVLHHKLLCRQREALTLFRRLPENAG